MDQEKVLKEINDYMKNSMVDHLGIEFISINKDSIGAKMPVTDRCRQPYGVLHGGASAALAETVASVGSHFLVSHDNKKALGVEVTAQHLKSVTEGVIFANARLVKKGQTLHTWLIDISNDKGDLICISKMIIAIK